MSIQQLSIQQMQIPTPIPPLNFKPSTRRTKFFRIRKSDRNTMLKPTTTACPTIHRILSSTPWKAISNIPNQKLRQTPTLYGINPSSWNPTTMAEDPCWIRMMRTMETNIVYAVSIDQQVEIIQNEQSNCWFVRCHCTIGRICNCNGMEYRYGIGAYAMKSECLFALSSLHVAPSLRNYSSGMVHMVLLHFPFHILFRIKLY